MLVIKNLDSRDKVKLFAVIFNSSLDFHCLLCSDFLSVKVFFLGFFCFVFFKKSKQTNKNDIPFLILGSFGLKSTMGSAQLSLICIQI